MTKELFTPGVPANTGLILFDMWQTIAAIHVPLLMQLATLLGQEGRFNSFRSEVVSSSVYTSNEPIEVTLPILIQNYIDDREVKFAAIEMWKLASSTSYLIPSARNVLELLAHRGFALGLVTNVDRYGYEIFPGRALLEHLFKYRYLSYLEGKAKPSPECWYRIQARSGVAYRDTVMVGDSEEDDMAPARRLGLRTIGVGTVDLLPSAEVCVSAVTIESMVEALAKLGFQG